MSPTFTAEVVVMPKADVADPQGLAIEQALSRLALDPQARLSDVRVGKVFHLTVESADRAAAQSALRTLADRVLANPNIEEFTCKVNE